ncbi:hypothetical protein SAMN05428934_10195 [Tessaracoccus flavus]|nr:hypothetical protein SAMN05428934_10195 [Tessaracoccus flavus]
MPRMGAHRTAWRRHQRPRENANPDRGTPTEKRERQQVTGNANGPGKTPTATGERQQTGANADDAQRCPRHLAGVAEARRRHARSIGVLSCRLALWTVIASEVTLRQAQGPTRQSQGPTRQSQGPTRGREDELRQQLNLKFDLTWVDSETSKTLSSTLRNPQEPELPGKPRSQADLEAQLTAPSGAGKSRQTRHVGLLSLSKVSSKLCTALRFFLVSGPMAGRVGGAQGPRGSGTSVPHSTRRGET